MKQTFTALTLLCATVFMPMHAKEAHTLDSHTLSYVIPEDIIQRISDIADAPEHHTLRRALVGVADIAHNVQNAKKFSPNEAQDAFTVINEALVLVKNLRQSDLASRGSHDSHHEIEDCLRYIRNVKCMLSSCCKQLKEQLSEISHTLDELAATTSCIQITSVPFICDVPGKYCVTEDLEYNGTQSAIMVTANNVSINFHNHSLKLSQSTATGIFAEDVEELVIENDKIWAPMPVANPSSIAIHLVNVDKATISNVFTENTSQGVQVEQSTDVLFTHCRFKDHIGGDATNGFSRALNILASAHVRIEDSICSGNSSAGYSIQLRLQQSCKDCRISRCDFLDAGWAIGAISIDGLLIEDSTITAPADAFYNFIQAGSNQPFECNNLIVRNCTFMNKAARSDFDGIILSEGHGCILDTLAITINQPFDVSYIPAAINIGPYVGTLIKDCVLPGTSSNGVKMIQTRDAKMDNCIVNSNSGPIVMQSSTDCAIKNCNIGSSVGKVGLTTASSRAVDIDSCFISNQPIGIEVLQGQDITIRNSKIDQCQNQAIAVVGASDVTILNNVISSNPGDGISIFPGSSFVQALENSIFNNGGYGIFVQANETIVRGNKVSQNGFDGINFDAVSGCYVELNSVFNNAGYGIFIDAGATGVNTFNNTSCSNGNTDCVLVSDALTPGQPSVIGGNLCCTSPS